MNRFDMNCRRRPNRSGRGGSRRTGRLWREHGILRTCTRSRQGLIWGVCRGLADHFNLSVGWVRFFTVLALLFTGVWPVLLIYAIAALLMKPEPAVPLEREKPKDVEDSYINNRLRTLDELKGRFSRLDQRLRRMEDYTTSRDYEWERRLNE